MKKAEKRQSEINGQTYKMNVTSQDERNFWKTKHRRKRFQNFRRSCVLSTDRIEIHQSHSRPQRPRSFWSAPKITTSGQVQRHSSFEWLWKHNRLRPEPITLVRLNSEHAQSDGKSVNRGLPVLDLARGRDFWC